MLRYKSSKLNFVLLNKPKSEDNWPIRLFGRHYSFLLKTTQSKVTSGPFVNVKKTLLSKILAVSVHESKQVSWASQLS